VRTRAQQDPPRGRPSWSDSLLSVATVDGKKLAATFLKLVDLKDQAHYGLLLVSAAKARNAVRWARVLVDRAREEVQR
jgi:hypothetical protein